MSHTKLLLSDLIDLKNTRIYHNEYKDIVLVREGELYLFDKTTGKNKPVPEEYVGNPALYLSQNAIEIKQNEPQNEQKTVPKNVGLFDLTGITTAEEFVKRCFELKLNPNSEECVNFYIEFTKNKKVSNTF